MRELRNLKDLKDSHARSSVSISNATIRGSKCFAVQKSIYAAWQELKLRIRNKKQYVADFVGELRC
jgi:hypothetical protein